MKTSVYSIITDRIVSLLEKGVVPWQKPWASSTSNLMPRNFVSKKPYRGVNVFLLHAMAFESPFWVSYKQAQELGGQVRKGEKSCPVVFWKWLDVEGQTPEPEGQNRHRVPMLRYYSVFNVAQCDGIELPSLPGTTRTHNPIESAEQIKTKMLKPPEIRHGNTRACYSPLFDRVEMPKPEAFRTGQEYYSVLFHELTHSTGYESRLNRKGVAKSDGEWSSFGSTPYAKEELVAEMGAAFLCGHAGIVERTIDNSAAYIGNWLERLKDDKQLVVSAAAQAQKASDFILGEQQHTEGHEVQS
jgi:antirestriction protein ArdC